MAHQKDGRNKPNFISHKKGKKPGDKARRRREKQGIEFRKRQKAEANRNRQ